MSSDYIVGNTPLSSPEKTYRTYIELSPLKMKVDQPPTFRSIPTWNLKKIETPSPPLKNVFFAWVMFFSLCWFILYDMCNINAAKFEKRQTDQLNTFQKLSWNHVLECQNTSLLVQAMLCTAANTSPVERGYTILQIVASKRRNRITLENLEVLLLLGTLKIPVKDPKDYENERKRLEKKIWTLNYILFSMRLYCKLVQKRKLK